MLYAAGVPNKETMKNSPQVGVATMWWEGNPCKYVYYSILLLIG
jgi:dihydroxy-acid dehydratase